MNKELSLEVKNLSFAYPKHEKVICNLSFEVSKGQLMALVGPDGAGKTTLLKLLTGLLKPNTGQIKIFGLELDKDFLKIKASIGYLSQNFSLYPDLSVEENIQFFAEIYGVKNFKQKQSELLDFIGLKPFLKRPAAKLSGGMKQKLALACCLIHSPKIIFLDEPTTGVDPVSRREFWLVLADLLKQGLTVIMSTPYMDEAERSDLVGLIYQGQLLAVASPSNLYQLLPFKVYELSCAEPQLYLQKLKSLNKQSEINLLGDRLQLLIPQDDKKSLNLKEELSKLGLTNCNLRLGQPSIENVFIWLLEKTKQNTNNKKELYEK